MDQHELRRAVVSAMGGKSIRAFAADLGLPKSTLHDFLSGRRDVSPDPVLVALYRNLPELRLPLEEYQRQSALFPEVADPGPLRRVPA